ncbi:MAG: hypothetical protein IGBAC_1127 [Ignavibacteriae bacterium]|nr:MAG: hypothetical protein IGBAC_1127 [Ignavibacteriota bacterium]
MFKFITLLSIIVTLLPLSLLAQNINHDELSTSIPELTDFHSTIYELWHNAWPNKDIEKLNQLLPEIESGYKKLIEVKLPGILRDKETAWSKNLETFYEIIEEYKNAISKDDTIGLLNAAEKVHSQFEALVRTIKPVVKELDDFHKSLYLLYHYYLPDYNYDKIKESVDTLLIKIEKLNKAELPKRVKSREKEFNKARKELNSALKDLKSVLKSKDKQKIIDKIELMHTKYQAVEAVFD